MFSNHSAWCRCTACTPRLGLTRNALIYGPAVIGLAALFFLLA